jgi:hypothetical protein
MLPFSPKETGKQLKHSETGAAPTVASKDSETIREKSESSCHGPPPPAVTSSSSSAAYAGVNRFFAAQYRGRW